MDTKLNALLTETFCDENALLQLLVDMTRGTKHPKAYGALLVMWKEGVSRIPESAVDALAWKYAAAAVETAVAHADTKLFACCVSVSMRICLRIGFFCCELAASRLPSDEIIQLIFWQWRSMINNVAKNRVRVFSEIAGLERILSNQPAVKKIEASAFLPMARAAMLLDEGNEIEAKAEYAKGLVLVNEQRDQWRVRFGLELMNLYRGKD